MIWTHQHQWLLLQRLAYVQSLTLLLESIHTVLTQPGTPVSFWGMFIYLLFNFWKLRIFQCFPFPENSGTPMFPISRNSRLQHFLILVTPSCISLFTCDSVVFPCFMLLFLLMYSGFLLLGSNDPNTIPDPIRIRCSRFWMLHYVSTQTPFLFGLRYVLCFFGLCTFRLRSLVIS